MSSIHDEIKSRIVLSSLVGRYVKLKKHGQEYSGCCPFHAEKTPSFTVNDQKQVFYCFGCGAKGDAFSFLEKLRNLPHEQILEELCRETGVSYPQPHSSPTLEKSSKLLEEACVYFQHQLLKNKFVLSYLASRKITEEAITHFRLGYAPTGNDSLQFFRQAGYAPEEIQEASLAYANESRISPFFADRLLFPIRSARGKVLGFGGRAMGESKAKYLNSRENELFNKGRMLFNSEALLSGNQDHPLFVVEGYADVVMLWQHGQRAVAPLGTALTSAQLTKIWRTNPQSYLCFDGDASGQKAMRRAAELALSLITPDQEIKFIVLPAGSDPDSFLRAQGLAAWQKLTSQAKMLHWFILEWALSELTNEIDPVRKWVKTEQFLQEKLILVNHPIIKKHYKQFFSEQLWQMKKGSRKTKLSLAPIKVVQVNKTSGKEKENKILAVLLYNPNLLTYIEHITARDQWFSSVVTNFEKNYPGWRKVLRSNQQQKQLSNHAVINLLRLSQQQGEISEATETALVEVVKANAIFSVELSKQAGETEEEMQKQFTEWLEELKVRKRF